MRRSSKKSSSSAAAEDVQSEGAVDVNRSHISVAPAGRRSDLMIRLCSCTGGSLSSLHQGLNNTDTSTTCKGCGGESVADRGGPSCSSKLNTMGLELSRFIDPEVRWKNVNKRQRAARRARTSFSGEDRMKDQIRSFYAFGNAASKEMAQDASVSESEKLGVSILGWRFGDTMENAPIKKKRFHMDCSPLPAPTPLLVDPYEKKLSSKSCGGISLYGKHRKVKKQGCEEREEKKGPFDAADFSGISILADAAIESELGIGILNGECSKSVHSLEEIKLGNITGHSELSVLHEIKEAKLDISDASDCKSDMPLKSPESAPDMKPATLNCLESAPDDVKSLFPTTLNSSGNLFESAAAASANPALYSALSSANKSDDSSSALDAKSSGVTMSNNVNNPDKSGGCSEDAVVQTKRDSRLHWDLNLTMEAWDTDCGGDHDLVGSDPIAFVASDYNDAEDISQASLLDSEGLSHLTSVDGHDGGNSIQTSELVSRLKPLTSRLVSEESTNVPTLTVFSKSLTDLGSSDHKLGQASLQSISECKNQELLDVDLGTSKIVQPVNDKADDGADVPCVTKGTVDTHNDFDLPGPHPDSNQGSSDGDVAHVGADATVNCQNRLITCANNSSAETYYSTSDATQALELDSKCSKQAATDVNSIVDSQSAAQSYPSHKNDLPKVASNNYLEHCYETDTSHISKDLSSTGKVDVEEEDSQYEDGELRESGDRYWADDGYEVVEQGSQSERSSDGLGDDPLSSRTKATGWDMVPEAQSHSQHDSRDGVDSANRVLGTLDAAGGGESCRQMGLSNIDVQSQLDRPRSLDRPHRHELCRSNYGYKVERTTDARRSVGRGGGASRHIQASSRGDQWVEYSNHSRKTRRRSPDYYNYGPPAPRNAAEAAVAKMESNGFVVAPDGTLVRAADVANAGNITRRIRNTSSSYHPLSGRSSPIDRDGLSRGPAHVREASPEQRFGASCNRSGRYGPEMDKDHITDGNMSSARCSLSSRQRRFPPHRASHNLSRAHSRASSGSRSRSPHAWTSPRNRREIMANSGSSLRRRSRSPPNYMTEVRTGSMTSPRRQPGFNDRVMRDNLSTRNHTFSQPDSTWVDGRNCSAVNLSDHKKRYSRRSPPPRFASRNNSFDAMDSQGRPRSGEFYRQTQERVPYGFDRGNKHDENGDDKREYANRYEVVKPYDRNGAAKQFKNHAGDKLRGRVSARRSPEPQRRGSPRRF